MKVLKKVIIGIICVSSGLANAEPTPDLPDIECKYFDFNETSKIFMTKSAGSWRIDRVSDRVSYSEFQKIKSSLPTNYLISKCDVKTPQGAPEQLKMTCYYSDLTNGGNKKVITVRMMKRTNTGYFDILDVVYGPDYLPPLDYDNLPCHFVGKNV